jgi:branched-chain amino acid transport system ATP-binding protein
VAVDHVDVTVDDGRVLGLIGPNGAGKSTLLDCLAGTQPLDDGRVVLDGRDVTTTTADERSRSGLVRTFQRSSAFGSLTVAENLRVGAENRSRRGLVRGILGAPDPGGPDARRVARTVMDRLGLRGLADQQTATLPTGTLRIVELGRALCARPEVLLLDEPASGLDEAETDRLRDIILALRDAGLAIVVVEHDLELVREVADTVMVMAGGKVLAEGEPGDVLGRAEVRTAVTGAVT